MKKVYENVYELDDIPLTDTDKYKSELTGKTYPTVIGAAITNAMARAGLDLYRDYPGWFLKFLTTDKDKWNQFKKEIDEIHNDLLDDYLEQYNE